MDAIRSFATFDGYVCELRAEMSRTRGTVPDSGVIQFRDSDDLPTQQEGDFVFYKDTGLGPVEIARFNNCLLVNYSRIDSPGPGHEYQVLDRRWKWEFMELNGRYNVRDDKGEIIQSTKKNPRELIQQIFADFQEPDVDTSTLPTDQDLAPEINWEVAAGGPELRKLLSMWNFDVSLNNDNTISVTQDGTGTYPPATNLQRPVLIGINAKPVPNNIIAYTNDTLIELLLELEAVAPDIDDDDTIKLIDDLNDAPAAGWSSFTPGTLDGAFPQSRDHKRLLNHYRKFIYRMYRIKTPNFTMADIPITDIRQLLPLEPKRITTALQPDGTRKRLDAEVMGSFLDTVENSALDPNRPLYTLYEGSFQIDGKRGLVMFSNPVVKANIVAGRPNGYSPAQLWLRTACRLRETPHGQTYRHRFIQPTGASFGAATFAIPRKDLQRNIIRRYDNLPTFNNPTGEDDNRLVIEGLLVNVCLQKLLEYQLDTQPRTYHYNQMFDFDTDGRKHQVSFSCGQGRPGFTSVSTSRGHVPYQTDVQRRARETALRKELEQKHQIFHDDQDRTREAERE